MKKLYFPSVIALLLLLAAAVSPALAHGGAGRVVGSITALDPTTGIITMQPRFGEAVTVQTSAETEFYRKIHHGGLEPIGFDDLTVGDRVYVQGAWAGDVFNASRVLVMTSASQPPASHVHGSITALVPAAGTVVVQTRHSGEVLVQTFGETEFYRKSHQGGLEPITFDDLAVEDRVSVWGTWDGEVFNADKVIMESEEPGHAISQ